MKKKTGSVKSAVEKQPTSTTPVVAEKTSVRSALSWLYAAQTTTAYTKTQRGRKKKAT